MAKKRSDNGSAEVSLGTLLGNLGPSVARVLVAPRGLDIPVGEAFIHDRLEESPLDPGAIVLAIGTEPDSAEARRVIANAVEAKAAAVAFKLHNRPCEWLEDAEKGGVAVLEIANEMGWSQLNALLTLSLPSLRQSAPVPGLASVPMGDLFALANAIAGVVGGAVTIEDPQTRVLAYSNIEGQAIDEARQQSILGRQVPDSPSMRDLYKQLWASDSVIHVEALEGFEILPRIAAPIRVGRETIGSLWAMESPDFDEEVELAFSEAARVAALHMIHARASRDIERRIKGDLLRAFLDGEGDVVSTATRLGLEVHSPTVVVALKLASNDPAEEELYGERLLDLVAMYSDAFRLRISWVAIGNTAYGLMPVTDAEDRPRVMKVVKRVHEHAHTSLNLPVVAAVGSTVTDIREVPASRREAERILRVLSSGRVDMGVASVEDVQTHVTLTILQDAFARNPDLVRGPVEEIARHDREKGSVYLDTLRAYLAAFGDVPTAAAELNVHPNTFRYRLRRLVEMFGVDLEDPDTRLLLHLQLRLMSN